MTVMVVVYVNLFHSFLLLKSIFKMDQRPLLMMTMFTGSFQSPMCWFCDVFWTVQDRVKPGYSARATSDLKTRSHLSSNTFLWLQYPLCTLQISFFGFSARWKLQVSISSPDRSSKLTFQKLNLSKTRIHILKCTWHIFPKWVTC